jgi:hypothetical protein
VWLLLAGTSRQGHKEGRGSDGRRSAAKEKNEHSAASHKCPTLCYVVKMSSSVERNMSVETVKYVSVEIVGSCWIQLKQCPTEKKNGSDTPRRNF